MSGGRDSDAGVRVLVVDDSVIYRQILRQLVSGLPYVARTEVARDGRTGLKKAIALDPDIITLDIEMPDISGLEVLRRLRVRGSTAAVVIVSSYTQEGSRLAVRALELGAVAVVAKPTGGSGDDRVEALQRELEPILDGLAGRMPPAPTLSLEAPPSTPSFPALEAPAGLAGPAPRQRPEIVVIGASTGGPSALMEVLRDLPADLPVPVAVALHMPEGFTQQLADLLDRRTALTVVEGRTGETLRPATVYLAPGGGHMRVARPAGGGLPRLEVTDDPPENNCRPSVDYLFRSVAQVYGGRAVGVILTGMGVDGTRGLRRLRRQGARVVAQDRETSTVFGMPGAAIEAGVVDDVVALPDVAACIAAHVQD